MDHAVIEAKVRKELRVREQLAARELARRAGLTTPTIARALGDLVDAGEAVKHPRATRGADRAPRYTKARK